MADGRLFSIILVLFSAVHVFSQTESLKTAYAKTSPVNTKRQTDPKAITINEAIDLALKQASNYRAAQINEQIVAEDIKQAKAAFYPKIAAVPTVIYTTPSLAKPTVGTRRDPSFLGANAITEYQGLVNFSGEIDTSGKLKATLRKNQALLESAHAGSAIARRELVQAVTEAYYNLALATTKRRGAENNLQVAQEFEANMKLQLDAGEIAQVDLVRARLQTSARRDELAQVQTDEAVNADALRFLVGYDFTAPIATIELLLQMPTDGEIELYTETTISARPEFAQFEADWKASEEDGRIARAERRTQLTYSVNGGFISDSLAPPSLRDGFGAQATVGVTIPLFDKGASKSRETQAKLKIEQTKNAQILAERQFLQQFFTARTQAISDRERIKQLAANITDAEQNVSASLARYRAGEAQINEVTDAQNLLITQRLALYQAIFDYQTARAKLLQAIGK